MPMAVEDILGHAELWFDSTPELVDLVVNSPRAASVGAFATAAPMSHVKHAPPTPSLRVFDSGALADNETLLLHGLPGHPAQASFRHRLHIAEAIWRGTHVSELNHVPVYARVRRGAPVPAELADVLPLVDQGTVLSILYVTLYPFNGSYRVCCCCEAGAHEADVEHLSVYVSPSTGRVIGAFFASHRMRDGEYIAAGRGLQMYDGMRVRAYVAKGGHGLYWRAGRIFRLFCLGNDLCGEGVLWNPDRVLLIDESRPVWSYRGKWGTEQTKRGLLGVTGGPSQQLWWHGEHPVSRGWFKRLFCQCMA